MPQQTDTAVPTRIASIQKALMNKKLRIAGRLMSYDSTTGLALVSDEENAILMDVSLCVDPWSSAWIREDWSIIMAIGYLETTLVQIPIPVIPAYAPAPVLDPDIVFRALLVVQATDLNLSDWNLSILEKERLSRRSEQI